METFKLQYKTTQFTMKPLTEEKLQGRLAGWNGQVGKVKMLVRVVKLDEVNKYRVHIERVKQIVEGVDSTTTVFLWALDLIWASKELGPLLMEMYSPFNGKNHRHGKKWLRAQDMINQIFKHVDYAG